MHPAIEAKLDDIIRLCREHGVKRLEIFGSAARGDDFDPTRSDVDFLVEFEESARKPWLGEYQDFTAALENLLGRKVDLVSLGGLAQMRNRFRQRTIEEDRRPVYAA